MRGGGVRGGKEGGTAKVEGAAPSGSGPAPIAAGAGGALFEGLARPHALIAHHAGADVRLGTVPLSPTRVGEVSRPSAGTAPRRAGEGWPAAFAAPDWERGKGRAARPGRPAQASGARALPQDCTANALARQRGLGGKPRSGPGAGRGRRVPLPPRRARRRRPLSRLICPRRARAGGARGARVGVLPPQGVHTVMRHPTGRKGGSREAGLRPGAAAETRHTLALSLGRRRCRSPSPRPPRPPRLLFLPPASGIHGDSHRGRPFSLCAA